MLIRFKTHGASTVTIAQAAARLLAPEVPFEPPQELSRTLIAGLPPGNHYHVVRGRDYRLTVYGGDEAYLEIGTHVSEDIQQAIELTLELARGQELPPVERIELPTFDFTPDELAEQVGRQLAIAANVAPVAASPRLIRQIGLGRSYRPAPKVNGFSLHVHGPAADLYCWGLDHQSLRRTLTRSLVRQARERLGHGMVPAETVVPTATGFILSFSSLGLLPADMAVLVADQLEPDTAKHEIATVSEQGHTCVFRLLRSMMHELHASIHPGVCTLHLRGRYSREWVDELLLSIFRHTVLRRLARPEPRSSFSEIRFHNHGLPPSELVVVLANQLMAEEHPISLADAADNDDAAERLMYPVRNSRDYILTCTGRPGVAKLRYDPRQVSCEPSVLTNQINQRLYVRTLERLPLPTLGKIESSNPLHNCRIAFFHMGLPVEEVVGIVGRSLGLQRATFRNNVGEHQYSTHSVWDYPNGHVVSVPESDRQLCQLWLAMTGHPSSDFAMDLRRVIHRAITDAARAKAGLARRDTTQPSPPAWPTPAKDNPPVAAIQTGNDNHYPPGTPQRVMLTVLTDEPEPKPENRPMQVCFQTNGLEEEMVAEIVHRIVCPVAISPPREIKAEDQKPAHWRLDDEGDLTIVFGVRMPLVGTNGVTYQAATLYSTNDALGLLALMPNLDKFIEQQVERRHKALNPTPGEVIDLAVSILAGVVPRIHKATAVGYGLMAGDTGTSDLNYAMKVVKPLLRDPKVLRAIDEAKERHAAHARKVRDDAVAEQTKKGRKTDGF